MLLVFMSTEQEILDQLKKITELLTPATVPPPKGLWNEFKDFINKYKVLGLAIAFIMGVYLGGLVESVVADLLLPTIGLAIPGLDDLATLTVEIGDPPQVFGVGNFLVALITFIIVAIVIFIIVKFTKKWGVE